MNIVFYKDFLDKLHFMQNSENNFLESLGEFLKINNIQPDEIIEKIFNIKNDSLDEEDLVSNDLNRQSNENDKSQEEYQGLINKLKNIKKIIHQLSLEISKDN